MNTDTVREALRKLPTYRRYGKVMVYLGDVETLLAQHPQGEGVICGCGDEIIADDGALCGTCACLALLPSPSPSLVPNSAHAAGVREAEQRCLPYMQHDENCKGVFRHGIDKRQYNTGKQCTCGLEELRTKILGK